jgi:GntR family transcriptional regulator, transcriptional repressor for pyruvate dehydrogenase complex
MAQPPVRSGAATALRPPSLVDAVVERLQGDILGGRYPPGSLLPPERELADDLGVTRTSLSQAFARLRELGLVETKHGVGTRVRDYERFGGLELLPALLTANASGWARETFEVRRELGAFVAAKAAGNGTPEQRRAIEQACEAVGAASNADAAQLAECEVHRAIAAATGNRVYCLAINAVLAAYLQVRLFLQEPFRDAAAAAERLRPMVDAVVAGDVNAAHDRALEYLAATERLMIGG